MRLRLTFAAALLLAAFVGAGASAARAQSADPLSFDTETLRSTRACPVASPHGGGAGGKN